MGSKRTNAGFSDNSFRKHRKLEQVEKAQLYAYRYHHPNAPVLFIDTNAGDGNGISKPQLNFWEEEVSRSSALSLAALAQKVGAKLILCEKEDDRIICLARRIKATSLSVVIVDSREHLMLITADPSQAVILNNHALLLDFDRSYFRQFAYVLWVCDPCGYSPQKGHPIEVLRQIAPHLNSTDFIFTFNRGAWVRMQRMEDQGAEDESPAVAGVRGAKPRYRWMDDLPQWAQRLNRQCAARTRKTTPQSPGYRFQLIVVADHFASCITNNPHEWEIYRGKANGIQCA